MIFAHDSEVALSTTAALVNTDRADADRLSTPDELAAFCEQYEFTGRRDGTAAELRSVTALRPRLRRLWSGDPDEVVHLVNQLLVEYSALPQLVRHDAWDWHLHATAADSPLAARMAVEAAMAMVDVIRTDELDRLTICSADDCDDVVVDLSKNRSRRYCESGCGNRVNVAAYRARRSGTPGAAP